MKLGVSLHDQGLADPPAHLLDWLLAIDNTVAACRDEQQREAAQGNGTRR